MAIERLYRIVRDLTTCRDIWHCDPWLKAYALAVHVNQERGKTNE